AGPGHARRAARRAGRQGSHHGPELAGSHPRGGPGRQPGTGGSMTTSYSPTPPTGAEEPPGGPDQQPQVQVAPTKGGLDALLDRRDFPTPDLIPPAILVRRQVRRSKRIVVFALLGVLALLAGLFVVGRVQLASATAELATA